MDVTDRKTAEAEADENRRLTVQVLELADLFDPDRRPEQVRRLACRHALRLFGCSTALVWTIEDHHLVLTAAAPDQPDWSRVTVPLSDVVGAPSHLGLLRPTWLPADQREALPAETRVALGRLGLESSLWVPMTTGGRAEALLCFGWRTPQARPGAERVQVLERFAGQVALAVSQSQRGAARDEAHQLTARLLSGLVPRTHWTYRGFDSAGLYQPGEDRLLLGGDFYDMLPRGEHSVTFVLGDVSGHGPEAAALGATLRAAWSGLARIDADPQTMLTALHQVVQSRRPSEETFATAVVGTIEAHSREARFALAGHPSPLVLDHAARTVPAITGPPLGVLDEPESWPVRHLVLPDPGALLLFTDGLIEGRAAPGSAERFGTERLLARLNRLARPWAASQADLSALVADVTAANGGPLADDVAVLLVSPRPAAEAACSPVTAEDDASA